MSNSHVLHRQHTSSYYQVEEEGEFAPAAPVRAKVQQGFRDRWQHADAVLDLIEELERIGRGREAAAVKRLLGHDDDEEAMRAYVSRLWAEDWDCPEDSVFDQL